MAPTMSSRIAGIGLTFTLLLVSSAQAVKYEVHRHDAIPANRSDNVILTSRDLLERLNFVAPKTSYTLQKATEHLLQFGALLRARTLDTFGSLLYVYYDDFGIAEVEALRKVYRAILERRYDIFDLVPSVLRSSDTRPSRICAEIYHHHATEACLRSSASVCRRIRKQHDLPHPDERGTSALNVTHRVYHLAKISRQYPRGFSLAATLRFLQREVLTITPNLLFGLLCNVRYEDYDDDVRHAEMELLRHFHEMTGTSEIPTPTRELRKFHTVNSFLKYYIDMYAEKFLDNDLRKHAFFIARRIADDVGTVDENIHLLGNVYENQTIHVGYLFDLVLPDDLLENDVIEAKRYLVAKLNKFNVVERYLRVQKYQQVTPGQLAMEITGQLRDIDFAKSVATSLRMHARFWRRSHMIESLDELLELFDTYENLRQVPRYLRMMRKIDGIKESLRDMKDVPVEILCNAPRACLRIGLQLVLRCKFISPQVKKSIKDFLELSDVCLDPVRMIQESRRSVEIPFRISKVRFGTTLQTGNTFFSEATTRRSTIGDQSESTESTETTESAETSEETTEEVPSASWEKSLEFTSTATTSRTTADYAKPTISTIRRQEETTAAITSTSPATTTPSAITTTTLPTTTTTLPATTLSTTATTLPTTTTTLSTITTMSPTTTTTSPTTLPMTTTTVSPTTISTTLPTTTTTTSPTTIGTTLPVTTTTTSTMVTTEVPIIGVEMKLERSKVKLDNVPYDDDDDDDEIAKPLKNLTAFIATSTPMTSCDESDECEQTSETTTALLSMMQSSTMTPTMQTSADEIIRVTSSGPSTIYPDFVSETAVSSTTESSEISAVTKGDNCAKTCLEDCRSKSESSETSGRSCETSCDSVTEDCDGEDSASPECGTGSEGRSCGCATKEEKSAECMTLCSSEPAESSSCEGGRSDCGTSVVPTVGTKLERARIRGMCEIRDPHHRHQLKRLAKMRAISAAAAAAAAGGVATSRADVLRPTASRHRDRIATKKLYNLLVTRLPHSKDRVAEYLLKRPLGDGPSGRDRDRRRREQRKQIYRQARRRLARRLSGQLSRGTTVHRTREITPSRHSQIKRISGRGAKLIGA